MLINRQCFIFFYYNYMEYNLYVLAALTVVLAGCALIAHHYQEKTKLAVLFKVANLLTKAEMQRFEAKLDDMLPYEVRKLNRLTPEKFEQKVREVIAPKVRH